MQTSQAINFQDIISVIKAKCASKGAKTLADQMHFLTSYEQVNLNLDKTYEMKDILLGIKSFVQSNYIDMREVFSLLRVKDACISLGQMKDFLLSYQAIKEIVDFFENDADKHPLLARLSKNFLFQDEVLFQLNRIIDSDGQIKDSCSSVLRDLRSQIAFRQKEMTRRIQSILNKSKQDGYSNTEDEVSIRNDRMVIPVKASYKRQVKGILHDTSQSGQTFFIEPEEIVEINFILKELNLEVDREIRRILMEFSDLVRENIDDLIAAYDFLVEVDFLRAKALYAIEINATKPDLCAEPRLVWYDARHPILQSALKQRGKSIVPLKIELSDKKRILIISGPNAGGKSVCLKTVALLQYMLQCGLLIPVKTTSLAGIFNSIFISIGDSQSIENDLSTYSSHLLDMKHLCDNADDSTLFLIDECGTGTDPLLGGAIAESILEYLDSVKAWGVVTTHYSNLKHLPLSRPSIQNAAMLFDTENMQPLFTLSIGTPGSSFAFEIAQKTGLSKHILNNAKSKVGKDHIRFEQQLQQIEVERLSLRTEKKRMEDYDNMLYQTYEKYQTMASELATQKKEILNQARAQAKEILLSANRQIEHAIEQVRTSKAEKQEVKKQKAQIQSKIETLSNEIKHQQQESPEPAPLKKTNLKILTTPLQVGDLVIFGQDETVMEIRKISKNKVELQGGIMSVRTTTDNVRKIDKQSYLKQHKEKVSVYAPNPIMDKINNIRSHFSPQIDLRGERLEDALKKVEQLLDTARLLGESQIKILHGKGDGILKQGIRNYLKTQSIVKTFYPEKIEFGGEGITIVELL